MARTRDRIAELSKEKIALVPYDPAWPALYADLEKSIKQLTPRRLIQRIAHIGSTAIPGLSAKPVIDIQVEVSDMDAVREEVVPNMEGAGYEFIWRPSIGDEAPFYAWFILRNANGERMAHVHMVLAGQASADRIIFRDYLRQYPEEAARYEALKQDLAKRYPKNRAEYTEHKTAFVQEVLKKASRERRW